MRIIIGIIVFALCAGSASAQTAAEKSACKADAYRFCTACIPGAVATLGGNRQCFYDCFSAHRRQLSRACDRVMKSHGY